MEKREYCNNIISELSGLKSKMDNVVSKFDHASSDDKKWVTNEVNELHKITNELDYRIKGLKQECA